MDTIQIGRPNAQPWREHSPPDASDIVLQGCWVASRFQVVTPAC